MIRYPNFTTLAYLPKANKLIFDAFFYLLSTWKVVLTISCKYYRWKDDSQKFYLNLQLACKKSVETFLRNHGHQFKKNDFEESTFKVSFRFSICWVEKNVITYQFVILRPYKLHSTSVSCLFCFVLASFCAALSSWFRIVFQSYTLSRHDVQNCRKCTLLI